MSRILAILILSLLTLPEAAVADQATRAATAVAEALARGEVLGVAEALHYPSGYTSEQKQEDVAAVAKSLSFLVERFGIPGKPSSVEEIRQFFHIGSSGGTIPYWESISPYPNRHIVFNVVFEKYGPGFVMIELIGLDDSPPIHLKQVDFGLAVTRPDSKDKVINALDGLLRQMNVPVPPNFLDIARQQIQPFSAPPAAPRE